MWGLSLQVMSILGTYDLVKYEANASLASSCSNSSSSSSTIVSSFSRRDSIVCGCFLGGAFFPSLAASFFFSFASSNFFCDIHYFFFNHTKYFCENRNLTTLATSYHFHAHFVTSLAQVLLQYICGCTVLETLGFSHGQNDSTKQIYGLRAKAPYWVHSVTSMSH